MTKWVVKPVELFRASTRVLGLKHPVNVKVNQGWWGASYDPFPLHVVWVNEAYSKMPDKGPSWTIWHELGHCLQCERDFGSDGTAFQAMVDKDYALVQGKDGKPLYNGLPYNEWMELYDQIPWEIEANAIADKYYEKYPLAKIRVT